MGRARSNPVGCAMAVVAVAIFQFVVPAPAPGPATVYGLWAGQNSLPAPPAAPPYSDVMPVVPMVLVSSLLSLSYRWLPLNPPRPLSRNTLVKSHEELLLNGWRLKSVRS